MSMEKCVVIGWDAPTVKSIKKYVAAGVMPNTRRLMREGVWAENCLVPHPTITPPNWTTIVTGSWPGTHQIICFNLLKKNTLKEAYQAFYKADCQAEYVWDAAGRAGKKTILLNYPSTWPRAVKDGIQIGGAGLAINEYRLRRTEEWAGKFVSADLCFTTKELPEASTIKIEEAKGWKNLAAGRKFKESEIRISFRLSAEVSGEPPWYILLTDSGKKFDKAGVYKEKDGRKPVAVLKQGEWSDKICTEIKMRKGKRKVAFKIKLLELSPDGENLRIYFTPLCPLEGFGFPEGIEKELENLPGLPLPNSFYSAYHFGWIGIDTLSEMIDFQNVYLGACAHYLLKNKEWTLFFMHAHCPDHFYHSLMNDIELDKKVAGAEKKFYESLDRMVGRILEAIDEEKTMVILTSDHGAVPTENIKDPDFKGFNVNDILEKKGLLVRETDEKTGGKKIVWEKTKAVAELSVYVYINLKSKYPHGIVRHSEYEKIQNEIINALYDHTDPKTGKKPIVFALKKQDARIIGLYGEKIGDVVYGVNPEIIGEHGRQITTGEYRIGSMKGLFLVKGPGIRKGEVMERTVWLTDIVPTICYALDLPVPRDCEGAVIYQIFQDPDFKIKEMEKLRKNCRGLKKAIEAEKFLTHSY